MTFQAYLNNIQAKTGMTPEDFRKAAVSKGFAGAQGIYGDVKIGQIVAWLKGDYGLGHGHAMAVVALLKGAKREGCD